MEYKEPINRRFNIELIGRRYNIGPIGRRPTAQPKARGQGHEQIVLEKKWLALPGRVLPGTRLLFACLSLCLLPPPPNPDSGESHVLY